MSMLRRRSNPSAERGSALLETAIVMPVALILMIGVIDFGGVYYTRATVEKSLRAAVRYLTTLPASGICTTSGNPAGWGIAKSKNLALYGNVGGTGSVRVKGWSTSNLTVTVTTPACPVKPGSTIRMNATFSYEGIAWRYLGLSKTLNLVTDYEGKWIGQ